jgi:GMP synthase-like glutamine amidotransferase
VILSGGPISVKNEKEKIFLPDWVPKCSARVLGICYGMLLIAQTFGCTIKSFEKVEHGLSEVTEHINGRYITKNRWLKRLDYVTDLPPNFQETGRCSSGITSFTDHNKWWAVHYHPEVYNHQDKGLFRRFLTVMN